MSGGYSFFRGEKNYLLEISVRLSAPQAASSARGRQKPGHADLLKAISIGLIAGGLVF
jgi:hypothetical protein